MNKTLSKRSPKVGQRLCALVAMTAFTLTACGSNEGNNASTSTTKSAEHGVLGEGPRETAGTQPRLVVTYDGGLLTIDAETLEVISDTKLEGFNRVNPVGDGRSVFVSRPDGFQVFDVGVWSVPHGDHTHSYEVDPSLVDFTYEAKKPGHVVSGHDRVILFGDQDGSIQDIDVEAFAEGAEEHNYPEAKRITTEPHHGVGVPLEDGGLLHTEGNKDSRRTIVALDAQGNETARTDECPGVHGESETSEAIVFGCEDGVVIYKDGAFSKVSSPDPYGRVGTQRGSEKSQIALGDYLSDKDAEFERPTRVSLINSATGEFKLLDLGTNYSFRSLGRGPEGEALVLGTNGELIIIDPETGTITNTIPVTGEWSEPTEWQKPRPTLFVLGQHAYVTEPGAKKLHKVDLVNHKVVKSVELPEVVNEITGVSGDLEVENEENSKARGGSGEHKHEHDEEHGHEHEHEHDYEHDHEHEHAH